MTERLFAGFFGGSPSRRIVRVQEGHNPPRELLPGRSQSVLNFIPTFNWGHKVAASKQLALALLLEATNHAGTALKSYEPFASTFISPILPDAKWQLTASEIGAWIKAQERQSPC